MPSRLALALATLTALTILGAAGAHCGWGVGVVTVAIAAGWIGLEADPPPQPSLPSLPPADDHLRTILQQHDALLKQVSAISTISQHVDKLHRLNFPGG